MEWRGRRESDNIEDQRSGGGFRTAGALGGGGLIIALIYALLGGDPRVILDQISNQDTSGPTTAQTQPAGADGRSAPADDEKAFAGVVLADTEDVWSKLFSQSGRTYEKPKLVLYSGRVQSACGMASSAVGPFYCPGDHKVYLDLSFFKELTGKLGAKGEFANAYVIAHEVGHHVQNLLGETRGMGAAGGSEANKRSVGIELQADCYAGVWAEETEEMKHVLEAGDLESAMSAAAAVGDDRLQRESGRTVVPDSFTHGSSAERMAAFKRGFAQGNPQDCAALSVAH